MRILHVLNDCSAIGHLPFLGWGGIQAMTGKLCPRNSLEIVSQDASQQMIPLTVSSTLHAKGCVVHITLPLALLHVQYLFFFDIAANCM